MIRLKEIDVIRCLVILMVIAVHTLAPFTNAWRLPLGFSPNETLWWLGKFCYSGMLETFVFISGYVFAIKSEFICNKDKLYFILKKIKRLYLPCVIFGIIMSLLFSKKSLIVNVPFILNGSYHLWFLPMLLWCFIFEVFIVSKIKNAKLLFLALVAVLPYPSLPLFLNNALYFLFFFHLGVTIFNNKEKVIEHIKNKLWIIIPIYILLFIASVKFGEYVQSQIDIKIYAKALLLCLNHLLRMISAFLCVMIYYCVGYKLKEYVGFYAIAKNIAKYSMGIYLFQEMVLRLIFYKTSICAGRSLSFLIIVYVFTFILSYLLTFVLTRCRFTKDFVS